MEKKLGRLTMLAILTALVVVLGSLGNFIKIGPFPISLTLCPIIVGAALCGPSAGALLGAVFGIVVVITGILGWDGGAAMILMGTHPFWLVVVCIVKTGAAGFLAGLVYRAFADKNPKTAVVAAGIVCPVVNTSIFVASMFIFWKDTLRAWAGGSDVLTYAITGMVGVNFIIELAINLALASAVTLIIKYALNRKPY